VVVQVVDPVKEKTRQTLTKEENLKEKFHMTKEIEAAQKY
jgi:hypothetical protein